jgi:Protein of unknown function (DUF3164)
MSTTQLPVPAGYWRDANDNLVPESKVKPIDKARSHLVEGILNQAKKVSADLLSFKLVTMNLIQAFVDDSLAQYQVEHGGKKGNITLVSFDGKYKVTRRVQDSVVFDERLIAAKALIDECLKDWSKGSNANIKALVNNAFAVDAEGAVSVARVMGLKKVEITDEKWQRAMKAIVDSMQIASSKRYINFYEREDATGEYSLISLDVAAL